MQSMIASQQQLIRRSIVKENNNTINSNCNTNESNGENSQQLRNSSNDLTNNSNNEVLDKDNDCAQTNGSSSESVSANLNNSDIKKNCDKSQSKKKRSNNSWLNILNPTYKTRHEEFKRLFYNLVPNNERLVVDYSCALQKEILVHGRLYLSLNYISFYANIFKWETSLVIKCRDITSLTKANTARVIPNAIQLMTSSGDKYVFTSFATRNDTYVMLFRIWQNALLDQPMSSAQLWQWVHFSYGEDLGLTSDDDEEYYSDNLLNNMSKQSQALDENSDSCNLSDPEVYEDCLDQMSVSFKCKCVTHEGKLIMNSTFDVTIDRAFELIFTDNKFIHNLHKSRRTYDLCVTQWEDSLKDKVRQLTYTVVINSALVKSARTIETQHLLEDSIPGKVYTIKSEADNEGVPYSDTFSNHSLWCLTQESENVTRIKVHAKIVYKKNIWGLSLMKSMIEKNSIQGITDFCNDLSKELPNWIEMERNLAIVTGISDLKINAKNIDFMDTVSSIDSIIPNVIEVSDMRAESNTRLNPFANVCSLNDTFLLKFILIVLLLSLFLNLILFMRISQIESKMTLDLSSIAFDTSQIANNSIYWKQFINNSIQMIKTIESNLLQIQNKFKDEL